MRVTNRRRFGLACVLLCLALALAAAVPVGRWASRSGGLLVLARTLDHPLLLAAAVSAVLIAAAIVGTRRLWIRVVVVLPAVVAGLAAPSLAVLLTLLAGDSHVTIDKVAPGKADRRLVVEQGSTTLEPVWWVYVDEGGWPVTRRWNVGYFNGDAVSNELVDASWLAADRLRLVTRSGRVHVVALSADGRPARTVTVG
jgi:hypothetical protein